MQLAQECLEEKGEDAPPLVSGGSMDGLEKFAQTIDNSENFIDPFYSIY
jgi:hypothetical protein